MSPKLWNARLWLCSGKNKLLGTSNEAATWNRHTHWEQVKKFFDIFESSGLTNVHVTNGGLTCIVYPLCLFILLSHSMNRGGDTLYFKSITIRSIYKGNCYHYLLKYKVSKDIVYWEIMNTDKWFLIKLGNFSSYL